MTITNAQFEHWLHAQTARVVLCEMDYAFESAGTLATGTIYLADRSFRTRPDDSPANVNYRAAVRQIPKLRRGLDRKTLGGRAELQVADLVLDNADGELDGLLEAILDGREVRFYIGSPEWARSDFRLAFVAIAERVTAPDESKLVVKLRDKRLLLDREVIGNQVGGSGAEANQFLPIVYGSSFNLPARIYDAATATWSVLSNYTTNALAYDVRVAGLTLQKADVSVSGATLTVDTGTETFTLASHGLAVDDVVRFREDQGLGVTNDFAPFAGMTSGQQYWVISAGFTVDDFRLSLTKGGSAINVTGSTYLGAGAFGEFMLVRQFYDDLKNTGRIQLSSSATGTVTVDVKNGGASGPFTFIEDFITSYGKTSASDLDSAAFSAADTAYSAKIGAPYHNFTLQNRENLLTIIESLSRAAFGWIGQTRAGLITCGLMDLSGIATATATRTLGRGDIAPASGIQVENDPVGFGRASVLYNKNQGPQTDGLVAAVTETDRRRYALPFLETQRSDAPTGTAYSTNPDLYHRTMVEAEPTELGELTDFVFALAGLTLAFPTDIANELVADAAPHRQFILAPCGIEQYDAEIGDVVQITYPRYGMGSGVNARVYGVTLDLTAWRVDLELVRIVAPSTSEEVL